MGIYFVYMVRCADGTLYTGYTSDVAKRLRAHNSGKGAKYTRGRSPVTLQYLEWASTAKEALRRERQIKKMSREAKLALRSGNKHSLR